MTNKKPINIFVVIAFLALAYPLLSGFLKKDNIPNLTGIVINNEKPKLDKETWFSGEYQN